MHSSQLTLCYQVTNLYSSIILSVEDFYCRNGVLDTNNISMASAPHQRCQHPSKGALRSPQQNGLTTLLALLLFAVRGLASTRPYLAGHIIRSNLPYLSPSKQGMNFYLISQMTFAHLTSNSMLCDNTLLCPRTLFSSPISS